MKENEQMRRFTTRAAAASYMRRVNRVNRAERMVNAGGGALLVLVDGPEDDFFVMDIRDAIGNDFQYDCFV